MSTMFDAGEAFQPPALDMNDMRGFLLMLQAQGWPEGLLVKQAIVSLRALHAAAERWRRNEGGYVATSPLWLDRVERDQLLGMMRGQRGVIARGLRQALVAMFPDDA
jgi:hypothetical protein